jgi:hypothetical protein
MGRWFGRQLMGSSKTAYGDKMTTYGATHKPCALTFKVKVSLRWIQHPAMGSATFDESKCSDTMKVSAR